jgi:hypothetical protein
MIFLVHLLSCFPPLNQLRCSHILLESVFRALKQALAAATRAKNGAWQTVNNRLGCAFHCL